MHILKGYGVKSKLCCGSKVTAVKLGAVTQIQAFSVIDKVLKLIPNNSKTKQLPG